MYLVDFGISKRFIDQENNHIPQRTGIPFIGNVVFASKNAFCEIGIFDLKPKSFLEQSRRDDIISLIYMLIFFLEGEVTWI